MKFQESFVGQRADLAEFIKKAIPELFGGRLVVEGKKVAIPADKDLEYKIKSDEDEFGGSFTLKVSWDNNAAEEEEEEEMEIETD